MATFEDVIVPRKRLATYGKAVRRRVPEYSFGSVTKVPERKQSESLPSTSSSIASSRTEPKKLKTAPRASPSKTPPTALLSNRNVFDVPISDNEQVLPAPLFVHNAAPNKTKNSIFDMPSRDDEPAPPPSNAVQNHASRQFKSHIFDVPSSDEEVAPSKLALKNVPRQYKHSSQRATVAKEILVPVVGDGERRKRAKLSPARPLPQKPSPVKSGLGNTTQISKPAQASKHLQRALAVGKPSTIVSRPKPATVNRKPNAPQTPRKRSPFLQKSPLQTPSPQQLAPPDMMDVDTPASFISPREQQMWKELLDPLEVDAPNGIGGSEIPRIDLVGRDKPNPQILSKTLFKPAGVTKHQQRDSRQLPRRRLIDSLVEQITQVDEMNDDESDFGESEMTLKEYLATNTNSFPDRLRSESLAPELPVTATLSASQGSQITGPRFTYSRQRSMLVEEDMMQQLALEIPTQSGQTATGRRPRRGSIPALKTLQSFREESEDEDGTVTTIRSVHELRQAGANNRYLDEIEDLLDRIGKPSTPPSSMRRSGLLDLACKIQDKNFVRQFRANGVEQKLFLHLGQETDVIAGFLMVSILMAVLVEANMPHIVTQLRRQGITRLLIRLLESHAPVVTLSKDRKNNMSKVAQSLVLEHQDFVLKMPMWEELQPQVISARTLSLKCLELMVRQTREAGNAGDIISKELTTALFSILRCGSEESSWNLPQGGRAIDFYLSLSALESHSIVARTVHDESIWIVNYLPVIADVLEFALRRPTDDFGPLQELLLRLTLNVTNNNAQASDVFARASLMAIMGRVIVYKLKKILRFLTEEDFSMQVDHLILVLGVMINFAEWSASARESLQSLHGREVDPLEDMVHLFIDNKARTSEAESVEESQKNVVFGYLSVLLGYLSLSSHISDRIAAQQSRKALRPLVESIEEFIGHHKAADLLIGEAEDGHNAQTGLTERLENLVSKLAAMKDVEK